MFSFQFVSSSPATSPNISVSGSNMSPICSEEPHSVSPPLPPRLHATLPEPGAPRVPSSLAEGAPHPPGFPALDPSNLAALSASYPRLGGGMMGLGAAMPGLPYTSSEQSPYSSISMENFYNPLVSRGSPPDGQTRLVTLSLCHQANPYSSIKEGGGPEMPSWSGGGLAATAAG